MYVFVVVIGLLAAACAERSLPLPEPSEPTPTPIGDLALAVADLAVADLAIADLAIADLAIADLAVADLAVADLAASPAVVEYGWPEYFGASATISETVVYAYPITVPRNGVVDRLGLVAEAPGGAARLALYRDEGGGPGELLWGSDAIPIRDGTTGRAEVILDDLSIQGGTYWLAARVAPQLTIGYSATATLFSCYQIFAFDQAWPASFGSEHCADAVWRHNVYARVRHDGASPNEGPDLGSSDATTIVLGWPTADGANYELMPAYSQLAQRIDVPETMTLLDFGIVAAQPGGHVALALFRDASDRPTERVGGGWVLTAVTGGVQRFEVRDTPILPGRYWLTAAFEGDVLLSHGLGPSVRRCAQTFYQHSSALDPFGSSTCEDAPPLAMFTRFAGP